MPSSVQIDSMFFGGFAMLATWCNFQDVLSSASRTAAVCQPTTNVRIFARIVTDAKVPGRIPDVLSPTDSSQVGLFWETSKLVVCGVAQRDEQESRQRDADAYKSEIELVKATKVFCQGNVRSTDRAGHRRRPNRQDRSASVVGSRHCSVLLTLHHQGLGARCPVCVSLLR